VSRHDRCGSVLRRRMGIGNVSSMNGWQQPVARRARHARTASRQRECHIHEGESGADAQHALAVADFVECARCPRVGDQSRGFDLAAPRGSCGRGVAECEHHCIGRQRLGVRGGGAGGEQADFAAHAVRHGDNLLHALMQVRESHLWSCGSGALQLVAQILGIAMSGHEVACIAAHPAHEVRGVVVVRRHAARGHVEQVRSVGGGVGDSLCQSLAWLHDGDFGDVRGVAQQMQCHERTGGAAPDDHDTSSHSQNLMWRRGIASRR